MLKYQGKSVYGGIAVGRIRVLSRGEKKVPYYRVADTAAEVERLESAGKEAVERLEKIYQKAVAEVGEEEAAIFRVHKMLLQDVTYMNTMKEIILSEKANAEYAAAAAGEKYAAFFSGMKDEYMQSRAADVKDVSEQLLAGLDLVGAGRAAGEKSTAGTDGVGGAASELSGGWQQADPENDGCKQAKSESGSGRRQAEPVIILAEDLTPSETVQLDKESVLAFVTVHGSVNSHTAILARTMNIPALIGTPIGREGDPKRMHPLPLQDLEGHLAVVDGYSGCFYVDPDEQLLREMEERLAQEKERKAQLAAWKGKPTVTADGRRLKLGANIGNVRDLAAALENDAEGIGLFRSECLYLGRDSYPDEEEQFAVYREVAEAMPGKKVVIRTLDIGADKQAEYFALAPEANPAMGFRAIRICLTRPEIMKTQLRALLRAAAYGNVSVLYPMVTSVREVQQLKQLLDEAAKELIAEGKACGALEQGIMIETPAAAMISDLLAKEADFFSIGTNDLTQYALAIDRENGELDPFYDAYHPAVLRLIELTVQNAHKAGISCGICGELAADPVMTAHFLEWGVDELSVSPDNILPLRKRIRRYGGKDEEL